MDDWLALNKLRGLTARQRRLLELEAVYEGTQYKGLASWKTDFGTRADGTVGQLCEEEREPTIKAGVVAEKVDKLVSLLVGEGRMPTLVIEGDDQLEQVLDEQVKLAKVLRHPTRSIIVKGSGPLGFAILPSGRVEARQMRSEWCEPIFVSQAGSQRAMQIRDELVELGVPLVPPSSPEDFLATPDDADSHDLCFLRYEYVYHAEEAEQAGGARDTVWRRRVDYLTDRIVYYVDVRVASADTTAPRWRLREPQPEPHGWGIVPVAWGRALDAEDGAPEGPSLVGESLRSIAEAADRMLTRKHDSVAVLANPKAYTIDLQDLVADVNADAGNAAGWLAHSREVLHFVAKTGSSAAKIGLLEPTGKGAEMAAAHLQDLLGHAQRVSGVIAHDPQKAAEVQSGVALERMMQPTVARVGDYRVSVAELLADFVRKLGVARRRPVKVSAQWGPVIEPTAKDLGDTADALTKATGGGAVMSQPTAARLFAQAAGVEDAEAEVKAVEAGAEEAMRRAREALGARVPGEGEAGDDE